MARPIKWTDEKKEIACKKIFERMSNGESCRSILIGADRKEYPERTVFIKWLSENEVLNNQYLHACEMRADYIFDEMFDISDNSTNDYMIKNNNGTDVEVVNYENVQRSRLRVDTRKWALSRMNPKKYGDKTEIDHTHNIFMSDEFKTKSQARLSQADDSE